MLRLVPSDSHSDGEVLHVPWIAGFNKNVNNGAKNIKWKYRGESMGRSKKVSSVLDDLSLR